MSDAPETIWINKVYGQHPEDWDFTDGEHLTKRQLANKVAYRLTSLPATYAQAMANPNVQVFVQDVHIIANNPFIENKTRVSLRRALAALEKTND